MKIGLRSFLGLPSLFALACLLFACGQEVKSIEVDPTTIEFKKPTQNRKITATAHDIQIIPVPNVPISFRSENRSVATVDSNGVVRPAGDGKTAIVAESPNGVQGETFVKVCLPREIICDPPSTLDIKVGIAAPIKCHVIDCTNEKIQGAGVELVGTDRSTVLKEGQNVYIGLKVGDTTATAKHGTLEKKIAIHVDEQTFRPGSGPGAGGGRGGGGGGDGYGSDDKNPYGGGGRFDHIIDKLKFE